MLVSAPWLKHLLFICIVLLHATVLASDSGIQLKSINNQIEKIKAEIGQKKQQQLLLTQSISVLNKEAGLLSISHGGTTKKLKKHRGILKKLTKAETKQKEYLQYEKLSLADQTMNLYQSYFEATDFIKTLFKKSDEVFPRLKFDYHGFMLISRFENMNKINRVIKKLDQDKVIVKKQTVDLERFWKHERQKKINVEKDAREKNKILGLVNNKIDNSHKKLEKLLLAKKNLESLIDTIQVSSSGVAAMESKTFICKNFVWPTKGYITTHFGSPIEHSSWRWNGMVIRANAGQVVRAISSGKVVYADKLSGYGLLVILDHGNGYISMYGHNSRLSKRLHDRVLAGEPIAAIGSADAEEPCLYFAIRYNGKPIDPAKWCKR